VKLKVVAIVWETWHSEYTPSNNRECQGCGFIQKHVSWSEQKFA